MLCVLYLFYKEKSLLAAKTKSETKDDDEGSREAAETGVGIPLIICYARYCLQWSLLSLDYVEKDK